MSTLERGDGPADSDTSEERGDGKPRSPTTWLSVLFPVDDRRSVLVRTTVLSLGFYLFGLALAVLVGESEPYLLLADPLVGPDGELLRDTAGNAIGPWRVVNFLGISALFGTAGVFVELYILGRWRLAHDEVWQRVERSFAPADRPRYRELVADHLDRIHHVRLDRVYDLKVVLAVFLVFEPLFIVVGNGLNPLAGSNAGRDLVLSYLNAVLVLLGLLGVFLFLTHLWVVYSLRTLELGDLYTSARRLEPLAGLGVSISVAWFVGVTILSSYYYYDTGDLLVAPLLGRTALTPSLVLHWFLVGVVIVVGLLVFLGPLWLVHHHVTSAKRGVMAEIDERRNELLRGWRPGNPPDPTVVDEFDLLEGLERTTDRIPTWPSFVSDLVTVVVSALIPAVQLLLPVFFPVA